MAEETYLEWVDRTHEIARRRLWWWLKIIAIADIMIIGALLVLDAHVVWFVEILGISACIIAGLFGAVTGSAPDEGDIIFQDTMNRAKKNG